MTRDEVMALTDEELRTITALYMGWENVTSGVVGSLWGYKKVSGGTAATAVPDYPHDIAAAWELFEAARNGERFLDFAQAMEALCDDPDMA
ncbi:MAG: hypothetical protein WC763_07065, partial [Candidatus Paceibacterota bacterium]